MDYLDHVNGPEWPGVLTWETDAIREFEQKCKMKQLTILWSMCNIFCCALLNVAHVGTLLNGKLCNGKLQTIDGLPDYEISFLQPLEA